MVKFTFICSIFLVLAFHITFSTSGIDQGEVISAARTEYNLQGQFEENTFTPNIFGEISPGQAQVYVFSPDTECFFSNSKDLQESNNLLALRNKTVLESKMSLGSDGACIINIPIYLQAGNFRL